MLARLRSITVEIMEVPASGWSGSRSPHPCHRSTFPFSLRAAEFLTNPQPPRTIHLVLYSCFTQNQQCSGSMELTLAMASFHHQTCPDSNSISCGLCLCCTVTDSAYMASALWWWSCRVNFFTRELQVGQYQCSTYSYELSTLPLLSHHALEIKIWTRK